MGLEARCVARRGRRRAEGTARLESDALRFRGDFTLRIPLGEIRSVAAQDGRLVLRHAGEEIVLELGERAAARWAEKIAHPPSRARKLGLAAGQRVAVIGVDDPELPAEIEAAGAGTVGPRARDLDLAFLGATTPRDLARLAALRDRLKPAGAIWVLWPKGRRELREDDVRAAALPLGLVDVKVAAFSAALSALKLVIRVAKRR